MVRDIWQRDRQSMAQENLKARMTMPTICPICDKRDWRTSKYKFWSGIGNKAYLEKIWRHCLKGEDLYMISYHHMRFRLEICQKIYTTRFLGQNFYTLKVCTLRLFLLKKKKRKCINLVAFLLKFNFVSKFLTVSLWIKMVAVYAF